MNWSDDMKRRLAWEPQSGVGTPGDGSSSSAVATAPANGTRALQRIVHVGPSRASFGGVAAVLTTYESSTKLKARYEIRFIDTWKDGPLIAAVPTFLVGLWRLRSACVDRQRPIVHIHMASRGSFYRKSVALGLAAGLGCSTILHLHGAEFHTFAAQGSRRRRDAIQRTFARADKVIALSDEWVERIAEFSGRTDAVVVPNPVSLPTRMTAGSNPPLVVFLGRLGVRKGTDVLLSAISSLQARGVRARYVLGGDGDLTTFRAQAGRLPNPEEVELPGWLSGRDKQRLLSVADVFCLPSRDEGVPIALLEAMAWGLACVVTPVGGVPSVVSDTVDARVVPVGEAAVLAEVIASLVADPVERSRLGGAARAHVASTYGIDAVAGVLCGVYSSLMEGARDATP